MYYLESFTLTLKKLLPMSCLGCNLVTNKRSGGGRKSEPFSQREEVCEDSYQPLSGKSMGSITEER